MLAIVALNLEWTYFIHTNWCGRSAYLCCCLHNYELFFDYQLLRLLNDWLVSWLHGLLVRWLHGLLVSWLHGLLVSWLYRLLVGRLICRLHTRLYLLHIWILSY